MFKLACLLLIIGCASISDAQPNTYSQCWGTNSKIKIFSTLSDRDIFIQSIPNNYIDKFDGKDMFGLVYFTKYCKALSIL